MPRMILDSGSVVLDEGPRVRLDVFTDTFDKTLDQLKKAPAQSRGGITPCIQGAACQGQTRHNVVIPLFDEVIQQMKQRG